MSELSESPGMTQTVKMFSVRNTLVFGSKEQLKGEVIFMRMKTVCIKDKARLRLSSFPNFSVTGSIRGMRERFYGKDALLVRCGSWIYNVSSQPGIYYGDAH